MAKVIMHKATDGELFEKASECEKHNIKMRLMLPLELMAEDLFKENADFMEKRDNVYDDDSSLHHDFFISKGSFSGFIACHADRLRKILNDALTVKRPRKAKLKAVITSSGTEQLAA